MKKKPTLKQAKALALIKDGVRPVEAMKKAGYSKRVSRSPKQNLLGSPAVQSVIEQYRDEYIKQGITTSYLAEKTKQWLEATKPIAAKIIVTKDGKLIDADSQGAIEVPDYQTQIKAAEFAREDLGIKQNSNTGPMIQINNSIQTVKDKYEI